MIYIASNNKNGGFFNLKYLVQLKDNSNEYEVYKNRKGGTKLIVRTSSIDNVIESIHKYNQSIPDDILRRLRQDLSDDTVVGDTIVLNESKEWNIWDNGIPTVAQLNKNKIVKDKVKEEIGEEVGELNIIDGTNQQADGTKVGNTTEIENTDEAGDNMELEYNTQESINVIYLDHNKQPVTSGKAVWKIENNQLELRACKGRWDRIISRNNDPFKLLEDYAGERYYYYDAFGYPLDSKDSEFALTKYVEYHNGLVIQLVRVRSKNIWKYDRIKLINLNKFKYYDKDLIEIAKGTNGCKYRLRRDQPDGSRQAHIDIINSEFGWNDTCKIINGINLKQELEVAINWPRNSKYYDKDGKDCLEVNAVYKKIDIPGGYARLYLRDQSNEWRILSIGSSIQVDKEFKSILDGTISIKVQSEDKIDNTPKLSIGNIKHIATSQHSSSDVLVNNSNNTTTSQDMLVNSTSDTRYSKISTVDKNSNTTGIIDKILYKLSKSTDFNYETLKDYIITCIYRNRRIQKNPIINTRLLDRLDQPIYIYDYGYTRPVTNINIDNIISIESLEQAKSICDEITIESLPEPLQWSSNPSDYIWNPSISISPISNNTYDIIEKYQRDKLNEQLRDKDIKVIMNEIQRSCQDGEMVSKIDIAYAIPAYDRDHDKISMMLPLKSQIISGNKVLNAMIFTKGLLGYSLYAIATVEEARQLARMFRDPRTTWLMEG